MMYPQAFRTDTQRFPGRKSLIAAAVLATLPLAPGAIAQEGLVLEEVIVTATKRESTLRDIAATVNVVTGTAIESFNQFSFQEIQEQTAGLTLDVPNARNTNVALRGIATDPEAGLPPVVDVYWNDAIIRLDTAFSQMYDLERLEILRGPQGTLQGSTSPAGAINIITRQPNLGEADGFIQGTVSDNEGLNGQFAYGAPLIEGVLGFRVAGTYDENNARDVENITTGLDDPTSEAKSARISLGWAPTDTFNATLVYQYFDRDVDDPKALTGTDGLGVRPTLQSDDRIALGKSNDFGDFEYDLATLTLEWEVAGHQVVAVTGYQDSDKSSRTENDRANYVPIDEALTFQTSDTEVDSWSQEIRIASIDNEKWDYMVGFFYQDQETDTAFRANTTLPGLFISFFTEGAIPVDSETTGIFTSNTFHVNEDLQLELGLRWSKFDRSRSADVFFGDLNYLPPPLEPIADLVRAGFAASFPINAVSPENEESDDDAITGMAAIRWNWTDEVNLYASYNRGYRPSGISIVPDPDVQFLPNGEDDLLHDEETSDAIEIGFKGLFWGGRASLNGAIYYQQFEDYLGFVRGVQVLNDVGAPVDIAGGLIFNGDANVFGVELEGRALLTDNWSVGGAMAYANAEWDGAEAPCNEREAGEVLGSCDIDGENIGGEPEWSVTLNSEYFMPLESMNFEWYLRGLYKFTGERDNIDASAGIGSVVDEFESYNIVNLYTGLRDINGRWDVSVWAKNVLDEDEVTFHTGSDQYDLAATGGSYDQTNILLERTVGATVRFNF